LTERNDRADTPRISAESPAKPDRGKSDIVMNGRYSSEELVVTAARAGFTCPSPQESGASLESAPKYITNCSNDRTLISLGGTITGANARRVFILGLDDFDFDNGPWLVGPNWALNGPGVAKLQATIGGEPRALSPHPTWVRTLGRLEQGHLGLPPVFSLLGRTADNDLLLAMGRPWPELPHSAATGRVVVSGRCNQRPQELRLA
jgi:hypothetical protein